MFTPLLNFLGDWLHQDLGDRNPQLVRELKSRFRGRGVVTAIALSGLAQVLLLLFYRVILAAAPRRFCSSQAGGYWQHSCLQNGEVVWHLIDWSLWWREIFVLMNWVIPIGLTGFGMYLLIGDIQQEEQRGTLNFIRLSPRQGTTIFLGKLLGIPILLYLGIALAVPLHLFAALGAKAPLEFVVSYYLLLVLDALLFLSAAIVVGLLVPRALKAQGRSLFSGGASLAIPLLSACILVPCHLLSRGLTVWYRFAKFMFGINLGGEITYNKAWQWYGIGLGKNAITGHGVQLLFLGVVIFWIWRILRRIYLRPNATTLSKRQSYGIVISGLVLFLGIFSPISAVGGELAALGFVLLICLIWLVSLCFAGTLLPSRQALLDWVQTRRVQRPSERSPLPLELLLGDRSPGIFAILVNLLILGGTSLVWLSHLPAYLTNDGGDDIIRLGLLLTLLMIAIYMALVQLLLFLKTPKRVNWAVGTFGFVALLPMICAGIAALGKLYSVAQILMLFSPLPWFGLIDQDLSPLLVGSAILVQVLILTGLLWKLSQDLNRAQIVTD